MMNMIHKIIPFMCIIAIIGLVSAHIKDRLLLKGKSNKVVDIMFYVSAFLFIGIVIVTILMGYFGTL